MKGVGRIEEGFRRRFRELLARVRPRRLEFGVELLIGRARERAQRAAAGAGTDAVAVVDAAARLRGAVAGALMPLTFDERWLWLSLLSAVQLL